MKKFIPRAIISALLALLGNMACAVGIAEPNLYSQLGQKLDCQLALINAGELTPEEMAVSISPLSSEPGLIKASIVKRSDGVPVIQLRSNVVINEPYLQFTINIRWPQGEVRREVTLLLDTPAGH